MSAPPRAGSEVLVVGPAHAGVSALAAALGPRLPGHPVVEADGLPPGRAPAAVVFAVSAAAPLVGSDLAVLTTATRHTDLVVGAVTKIDVHRDWRTVLAADAQAAAAHQDRYRAMSWTGVAAAPPRGPALLDDLVTVLTGGLAETRYVRRNQLRAMETHIDEQLAAVAGPDTGAMELHRRREHLLHTARLDRRARTAAARSRLQQARVQLGYLARNRCAVMRNELSEDAAGWGHPLPVARARRTAGFQTHARQRAGAVIAEVDAAISAQLRDIAAELRVPAPPVPASAAVPDLGRPGLAARRLEMQLMLLLGTGFGLGVALAAGRLFAGLAAAGAVGGGLLGLALTAWVVGIRGLLHDRAQLDRWVTVLGAAVRESCEALVGTRLLAAEAHFAAESAAAADIAVAGTARQVAALDAQLRERAVTAAAAVPSAERRLSSLRATLTGIRAELAAL